MLIEIGKTIAHYKILEELGRGGMGVVYLAEDTKLKRNVALKILPSRLKEDSDQERFIIEAQAAGSINHPNVCVIHEILDSHDPPCIVMEYVEGQTLREFLSEEKTEPLDVNLIIKYAIQIAEALSAAHKKQIIHRDIKSDNIMVTGNDQIKVMDFGLAKLRGSANLTKTSSTVGTLAYMAPEQLEGKDVDHRTDIFSLGVLLYEMLTNQKPFRGDYEAAIIYSILNEDPESILNLRPDIPAELIHILDRSLEKVPEERYQSMDDLLIDLRRLKRDTSKISAQIPITQSSREKIPTKPTSKKSKLFVGVGALILLLIIVIGAVSLLSPEDKIETLAILPFINTTGDMDTEYLSDGIPESIISSLQKMPDLRVASFHSVLYRYKNKDYDPSVVGDELNVASVAMGRLTLHGENVSINIEIIDTRDNTVILAKQYIENLANIFEIQSKIAQDITSNLQLELTGKEQMTLSAPNPTTADAYNEYLRGRHFMVKRTPEDFRKAIAYFKSAIEKDPNYALAHAGLADTYRLQEQYGGVPAYRTKLNARKAAERALLLDSLSAEVQTAMGGAYLTASKLSKAKERFQKAIQLNPNYILAYHWLGITHGSLGEISDQIKIYETGLERDPLSPIISGNLATCYATSGQVEKAINLHKKNMKLFPDQSSIYRSFSQTLTLMDSLDEAINMMERAFSLDSLSYWSNITLGWIYYRTGDYEKSIAHCKKMIKRNVDFSFGALIMQGMNYRVLGNQTMALESYHKAIEIDPLATEPRGFLGRYYLKMGAYEEALLQYKKNFDNHPDDFDGYVEYALTLATIKRYDEAIEQLEHAVEIDPTWHDYLGLVYYFSQDLDQAIRILNKAIKLHPQNIYPVFFLAIVNYSKSNYEECAVQFNKYFALQNFPDREKIYSESFSTNQFTKSTIQRYLNQIGDRMIADKIPLDAISHQVIIFALSGNKSKMMEYLNKAQMRPVSEVHVWMTSPLFKPYHSDPDFISLFKKMKLDKYHTLH